MSRLDELIAELCPDGVEYKKIGELVNYEQPSKYIVKSTDYNDAFETPVLTAGQTFILGYTNEENGHYLASKENPVIIFDDFTGAFKWVDFEFKVKSSAMKILTANKTLTSIRYIFHVMGKLNFTSSEHKRLWIGTYSEFEVPVPPLEVQREIVRILDNFTELIAELIAELTARKQQYEYYAEKLLSFDDTYDYLPLSDVADFRNGKGHEKSIVASGKYIVVNSKFISTNGEVKKYANEQISPLYSSDILMVMSDLPNGRALAKTFLVDEDDTYTLNQRICALHVKNEDQYMTKFLYFFLNRNPQLLKYDNGVDQTNLKKGDILSVQVPVISIETQKSTISFLERLETLCLDISSGLPAEIEARQKQYEYYRDKLLTFKELN